MQHVRRFSRDAVLEFDLQSDLKVARYLTRRFSQLAHDHLRTERGSEPLDSGQASGCCIAGKRLDITLTTRSGDMGDYGIGLTVVGSAVFDMVRQKSGFAGTGMQNSH